jgi:MFS family permease
MMRRGRIGVVALLASVAMTNVAYTMLIPLVPELVDRFKLSTLGVAAAFGGFALAKAVAQPFGGIVVDRLPRLATLAGGGLLLTAMTIAGLAFASNGQDVIGWRLAWGVAEGLTIPVLYRLANSLGVVTGLGATRVLGWFGGSAVAGMAAGPVLVAALHAQLGFIGVFLAGSALTATSGILLWVTSPQAPHEAREEADGEATGATAASLAAVAALVGLFAAVDLLNNFVYSALEPVLPLHIARMVSSGALTTTAALFTGGLVVFAVVSAGCARLVDAWPLPSVASAAFAVAAAGLATVGLASHWSVLGLGFLMFMASQPVLYVVARRGVALISRERLGRAYGAFGLLSDLGFVAGPIVGALLYNQVGPAMFVMLAVAAAVGGVASAAARNLPLRLLQTSRQSQEVGT